LCYKSLTCKCKRIYHVLRLRKREKQRNENASKKKKKKKGEKKEKPVPRAADTLLALKEYQPLLSFVRPRKQPEEKEKATTKKKKNTKGDGIVVVLLKSCSQFKTSTNVRRNERGVGST
jgi:hypothetical protein